jgi:hypothetical protein
MAKPRATIERFRDNGKCRNGQKNRAFSAPFTLPGAPIQV